KFLRVLNRHGRLGLLPSIYREARLDWERRHNRRAVMVRTAQPLDDSQQDALRARLETLLGATPVLQVEVDPSLIGGLIVQAGDEVFDVSIRNQLETLRRRLIEEKGHELQARREQFHRE